MVCIPRLAVVAATAAPTHLPGGFTHGEDPSSLDPWAVPQGGRGPVGSCFLGGSPQHFLGRRLLPCSSLMRSHGACAHVRSHRSLHSVSSASCPFQ